MKVGLWRLSWIELGVSAWSLLVLDLGNSSTGEEARSLFIALSHSHHMATVTLYPTICQGKQDGRPEVCTTSSTSSPGAQTIA